MGTACALATGGAGAAVTGAGSLVGLSGNVGATTESVERQGVDGSWWKRQETIYGVSGGLDVAGVALGKVHGFGCLDWSTGIMSGVTICGGESVTRDFIACAHRKWQTESRTVGLRLMGMALEVPYSKTDKSEQTNYLCGIQLYKCEELREQHFGGRSIFTLPALVAFPFKVTSSKQPFPLLRHRNPLSH